MLARPWQTIGAYQRREFDLLEVSDAIDASAASRAELSALTSIACENITAVQIEQSAVERVHRRNRHSIYPFRRRGKVLGGIGFLHLNDDGFDALILDEIDFRNPDPRFLVATGRAPTAIYVWAIVGFGHALAGLGNVVARMNCPPFAHADYFTQPVTREGTRLAIQLGFEPTPSYQPNLWTYQRLRNRDCKGERYGFAGGDHGYLRSA